MKWNYCRDGGPNPEVFKDVFCAHKTEFGEYYYQVGWWTEQSGWVYDWDSTKNGTPPAAWCYIELPVKSSEDE